MGAGVAGHGAGGVAGGLSGGGGEVPLLAAGEREGGERRGVQGASGVEEVVSAAGEVRAAPASLAVVLGEGGKEKHSEFRSRGPEGRR